MAFSISVDDLYKEKGEKYEDAIKAATTFFYIVNWIEDILQMRVYGAVLKRKKEIKKSEDIRDFGDVKKTISTQDAEIDYPLGIIRILEPAQMVDRILNDRLLHLYHPCIIECSDTTRGLKKISRGVFNYNSAMYNGGWHTSDEQHRTSYEELLKSFIEQDKIAYVCCDKSSLIDRIVLEARDIPKISLGRMRIIIGKEITPKRHRWGWRSSAVNLLPRKINIERLAILG